MCTNITFFIAMILVIWVPVTINPETQNYFLESQCQYNPLFGVFRVSIRAATGVAGANMNNTFQHHTWFVFVKKLTMSLVLFSFSKCYVFQQFIIILTYNIIMKNI